MGDYRIEFAEAFMAEVGCGEGALDLTANGWRFFWRSPGPSLRQYVFVQPLPTELEADGWDAKMQARVLASETRAKWGGESGFDPPGGPGHKQAGHIGNPPPGTVKPPPPPAPPAGDASRVFPRVSAEDQHGLT